MSGRSRRYHRRNGVEWAVFGVGAVLVACVVGFLLYDAFAGPGGPADLRVRLRPPEQPGQAAVRVEVRNVGGRSAEEVVVEVCSAAKECGEVTFPFVPRGAMRDGVIGFADPPAAPLEARVMSYREV
ncbi:MAG TPA: hypothetical protein VD962_07085 [Rubricoccaceae bacterium]|nr:hypothetical protein [Rubricoccaceae bacterium]